MRFKSLPVCILIIYTVLHLNTTQAQCSTGAPQTITVFMQGGSPDLLFNTYQFEKFNPSLGTLTGISFHATTSGTTVLQIINGDTFDNLTKKITFQRTDEIEGPGLGTITINDTTANYPDTAIRAGLVPPTGDLPPYEMNDDYSNVWTVWADAPDNKVFDTVIDPAYFSDYSGSGNVNIDYNIYPYFSALSAGKHTSKDYVTLATNLNMSITYTYCPNSVLPVGKLDFFARATENANVQLNWTKEHEGNNIVYEVEMSTNGQDFSPIGTMQSQKPAVASTIVRYEYEYNLPGSANGKLYFRIKQTDAAGKVQYSAIRSITTGSRGASPILFPNPATDHVTIQFGTAPKNRLRADVINSIGQVVERGTDIPAGTGTAQLRFKSRLASGVYFLRTIDAITGEQQVSKLVIR